MLLVPICRDMQFWWDKPPIPSPRNCMPTKTCFDDVGRWFALVWREHQCMWLSKQKNVFHSKAVIILFFNQPLCIIFFRYSFQYKRNSKALYTFYPSLQKIGRRDYHLFGAMHITLRGLRFVDVSIIYPTLGKVLFQISFTNYMYENISAHSTALVTSGNSGLPRLNSNRRTYPSQPSHQYG